MGEDKNKTKQKAPQLTAQEIQALLYACDKAVITGRQTRVLICLAENKLEQILNATKGKNSNENA